MINIDFEKISDFMDYVTKSKYVSLKIENKRMYTHTFWDGIEDLIKSWNCFTVKDNEYVNWRKITFDFKKLKSFMEYANSCEYVRENILKVIGRGVGPFCNEYAYGTPFWTKFREFSEAYNGRTIEKEDSLKKAAKSLIRYCVEREYIKDSINGDGKTSVSIEPFSTDTYFLMHLASLVDEMRKKYNIKIE